MKRILKSVLTWGLILSFVLSTSAAMDIPSNNVEKHLSYDIFESRIEDYIDVTGTDKTVAIEYYNYLIKNGIDEKEVSDVESLLPIDINNKSSDIPVYVQRLIYAQENYVRIVENLSSKEIDLLNRYLLNYTLLFTAEYAPALIDYHKLEKEIDAQAFVDRNSAENGLYENSPQNASGAYVCELSIFSQPTGRVQGGVELGKHAWLSLKNISTSSIKIGALWVSPGKTVTISTWDNFFRTLNNGGHAGIHYNLEAYTINLKYLWNTSVEGESFYNSPMYQYEFPNRVSTSMMLTSNQLDSLNRLHFLNPAKDRWSHTNNCANFSVSGWNLISSDDLGIGLVPTPAFLGESIRDVPGYDSRANVPYHYRPYYRGVNPTVLILNYNYLP